MGKLIDISKYIREKSIEGTQDNTIEEKYIKDKNEYNEHEQAYYNVIEEYGSLEEYYDYLNR